jgi:hypothetical protein
MTIDEIRQKAHEKVDGLTDTELMHFTGYHIFKEHTPLELSEYAIWETVEIVTFIPTIGEEFVGQTAMIQEFVGDNLVRVHEIAQPHSQYTGKQRLLTKDRIRKLNETDNHKV